MWSLREPSEAGVRAALRGQRDRPFSYDAVGATRPGADDGLEDRLPRFDVDRNRTRLGEGEEVFEAARRALDRWEQFPPPWTRVGPAGVSPREGAEVAMMVHALGLWWLNACRIVYTLDDGQPDGMRRSGFAYGTLPRHVERGEERFSVELRADGSVWYDLLAFSRPRYWMARLGYPIARALQRRFVRDSQRAMHEAVRGVPGAREGA